MSIPSSYDEVITWDIEQLWNTILILQEDTKEYDEQITTIRNGKKLKVPIYYIIQEWYNLHPENKRVSIKGHGKMNIEEFMEEVQWREKQLRLIILDNLKDDSPIQAR